MSDFTIKYYGEDCEAPVVIYISGRHSAEETPLIYERIRKQGTQLKSYIEKELLNEIDEKFPAHGSVYASGYSLAGLFALWAAYEIDVINGVACCSGSLWYPGWAEYANERKLNRRLKAFTSLGFSDQGNDSHAETGTDIQKSCH